MTEQKPEDVEAAPHPEAEEAPPTDYADMTRRQHLRAALRGRPILIATAAITTLAVGLGGFGVGYAVGHDDGGDRFSRVVFERGELSGGPGEIGRGYGEWRNG